MADLTQSPARRSMPMWLLTKRLLGDPMTFISAIVLIGFILLLFLGQYISGDAYQIDPLKRLSPPDATAILGRDHLGRDVFARAVQGTYVSMLVGFTVAIFTTLFGVMIGLYAGMSSLADGVVMRLNDALMAIPAILLAIALAAVLGGGITTVIVAITLPEIPRMVRLVRSVVLGVKQQPYVMAAESIGTTKVNLILRHILPNILGAVLVQATYACASAIIASAVLSFLGVGIPPEVPSWGGMMADAKARFRLNPELMFYPGILLSLLVLAVNILGDRLSDALDPRKSGRTSL